MVLIRYFLILIILVSVLDTKAKESDFQFSFESKVDTLEMLSDSLIYAPNDFRKIYANINYKRILKEVLSDSMSIIYNFSRVKNLSVVTSTNNQFRVYTWTLLLGKDEYDYFGFTQYQRTIKKGLFGSPKIENVIFELTNRSSSIGNDELANLSTENWLGCVYYNVVPAPKKKDKTFLLLGWDGYAYSSTKKLIETVKFNNKGKPSFGHKIIKYDITHGTKAEPKFQNKSRIIFEYNGNVTMHCNYNPNLNMIVFDHLAPSNPTLASVKRVYAPDFTYDALLYQKKFWTYQKDIDVRNKTDVKAIKWRPKDIQNRKLETIIPMRN
ncbi:MAG: hypothetical protein CMD18_01315 [Flavobacteriales bacterium]|nr:hypothetical protein [Flavobacteriales bacterium]